MNLQAIQKYECHQRNLRRSGHSTIAPPLVLNMVHLQKSTRSLLYAYAYYIIFILFFVTFSALNRRWGEKINPALVGRRYPGFFFIFLSEPHSAIMRRRALKLKLAASKWEKSEWIEIAKAIDFSLLWNFLLIDLIEMVQKYLINEIFLLILLDKFFCPLICIKRKSWSDVDKRIIYWKEIKEIV